MLATREIDVQDRPADTVLEQGKDGQCSYSRGMFDPAPRPLFSTFSRSTGG